MTNLISEKPYFSEKWKILVGAMDFFEHGPPKGHSRFQTSDFFTLTTLFFSIRAKGSVKIRVT